jgi:hypothetical protein
MGKKKKKASKKAAKSAKRVPYTPITIVVPDQISADDKAVLQGIARVLSSAGAAFDISQIKIVSSNKVSPVAQGELKKNEVTAMSTCPP